MGKLGFKETENSTKSTKEYTNSKGEVYKAHYSENGEYQGGSHAGPKMTEKEFEHNIKSFTPEMKKVIKENPDLNKLLHNYNISIMKTSDGSTILGSQFISEARKAGIKGKVEVEPMSEYWAKELIELYM